MFLQVEQITAEYKVLALQYHPDKNAGNKEAEAKFQKLNVSVQIQKCLLSFLIFKSLPLCKLKLYYSQWVSL